MGNHGSPQPQCRDLGAERTLCVEVGESLQQWITGLILDANRLWDQGPFTSS